MLRRLFTFPDARGQRWSFLRLGTAQQRNAPSWRRRLVQSFILICWILLLFVIATNMSSATTASPKHTLQTRLLTVVPALVIAFLFCGVGFALMLHFVAPRIAAATVAKGRCPACGHSLANLPPTDPITCSECGAAWHPVPSKPSSNK